ncbi:MAG: HEPN domain-containing protein [Candidatus Aenigmarchaeota archaeon]|nr:HEPN domain-containing protein [Candidatus Aenigmarchaeota archaeon]
MENEIDRWIKRSEEDFETAKANFKIRKYRFASFLCQQAVEKALKALLLKKTKKIIRIHDLVELGKRVDIENNYYDSLEKLTYVYVDSRYPDTSDKDYTLQETKEDLKIAEEVIKWIKKKI